jgi:chaperonin GroEL
MKEKKARVEDAMHATRAAVEEGIVAGGGVTLVRASKVLDDLKLEDSDEQIGVNIIKRAVEEPLRQIVANAGKEGAVVVEKIRAEDSEVFGFNAATEKSTKTSSQPASSTPQRSPATLCRTQPRSPALMLTTEAMIADAPDEKGGDAGMGGMGGGMGGMGMGM